jgi:hypothetical protein
MAQPLRNRRLSKLADVLGDEVVVFCVAQCLTLIIAVVAAMLSVASIVMSVAAVF